MIQNSSLYKLLCFICDTNKPNSDTFVFTANEAVGNIKYCSLFGIDTWHRRLPKVLDIQ